VGHTQFAGPGRSEANIVGERVWPTFAAKGLGAFLLTSAVLCALGGLAQINPIWLYGPYRPAEVSSASQPDWYMGWLDGALRLWPAWEIRAFGFELPTPFYPSVLLPGITFALLAAWPFLEARLSGDRREHHLLDRPRDRPLRTAFGISTLTFYTVLFFGGASDVLAVTFQTSVNALFQAFRIALLVLPPVAGAVTFRLCQELARRDRPPPGTGDPEPPAAGDAPDAESEAEGAPAMDSESATSRR
jgi:ubiquinol-cytochrome c reductase cytochrome b subunit